MPAPDLRNQRALVHAILRHAHTLLGQAKKHARTPMAELLRAATESICDRHAAEVSPHHVAWLEAEAASQVITAAGWRSSGLTDPALPQQLQRLDRHTVAARRRFLALAVHDTAPGLPATIHSVKVPRQRTLTTRSPGPCPCCCNTGGFCGGCGHAGCGRRH